MKHVFVVEQIAHDYDSTNYLDSIWSSKELADKRVAEIDEQWNFDAAHTLKQGWRVRREHVPSVIAMQVDGEIL